MLTMLPLSIQLHLHSFKKIGKKLSEVVLTQYHLNVDGWTTNRMKRSVYTYVTHAKAGVLIKMKKVN